MEELKDEWIADKDQVVWLAHNQSIKFKLLIKFEW